MNKFLILLSVIISFQAQAQIKRVLFLGNSYTQVNDLPVLTANLAISVNDTLLTDSNTPGGYTLEGHSTNATSLSKIMLGEWDYVVLQEQSQRPSLPIADVEADVFPYAHILDSVIDEYNFCGRTMFYMTWGRENGDASNCNWWPPVCTYEGMDSLLHLRYMMMGLDNDAAVSPVGALWRYIRSEYPEIELYSPDQSHPSAAGSYAAACSFYTAIFKKNPELISYDYTVSSIEAAKIRAAAKIIVYDSLSHWFIEDNDLSTDFTYEQENGYDYQFTNLSLNSNGQIWDFGESTDTSYSPLYTFPGPGIYTVSLKSYNECDTLRKQQLINVLTTSVNNKENKSRFKLFPNPVKDYLKFSCDANMELRIDIYNSNGVIVLSGLHNQNEEIKLNNLANGVYLFEASDSTKKIISKKFIIQK